MFIVARFITRTVLAVALTFACLESGIAQAQESTAHEPSAAENDSAVEASKQAAIPLASVWLMQFQQNSTWIGMPANGGNRVFRLTHTAVLLEPIGQPVTRRPRARAAIATVKKQLLSVVLPLSAPKVLEYVGSAGQC